MNVYSAIASKSLWTLEIFSYKQIIINSASIEFSESICHWNSFAVILERTTHYTPVSLFCSNGNSYGRIRLVFKFFIRPEKVLSEFIGDIQRQEPTMAGFIQPRSQALPVSGIQSLENEI